MEYALGAVIAVVLILVIVFAIRSRPIQPIGTVIHTQSHIHKLIYPFLPTNSELRQKPITQATKHFEKISTRVVFYDDKAYWIKDGVFYVADTEDEEIKHETAVQVDTISMDKVQLNKIMFVVERLTEGKPNDSRDSW